MTILDEAMKKEFDHPAWWRMLSAYDWVWSALLLAGVLFVWRMFGATFDMYEIVILAGSSLALLVIALKWKAIRTLSLVVALLSLAAVAIYGGDQSLGEKNFFLRFLISSPSAIMWMSVLFVLATVTYFFATFKQNEFAGKVATAMTWSAVAAGFIGLMVRWYESYLIAPDVGHIPVSNLYEVFILFSIITALIYLHYEAKFQTRSMGGFVLLVISAAIAFLLWYQFDRGASRIQPLVPALQSYWMKIHVPANFIGYGGFSLAAMLGVAYLWKDRVLRTKPNGRLAQVLPDLQLLDDVMHKSIALGFAFFTIATVLGAMWAAEAWGGYWSWDPKETWALIVWLNYAAWLHMRLTKGWRGRPLAMWAVIGLLVTTFAFLGVNMFLSGLHSYGTL